ncbi:hypothetical protein CMI38_01120 [Candidatus Pacearchaeota archaeon]|nr:hypothetical protein [Candidatus Pacearchaeota archaeon]
MNKKGEVDSLLTWTFASFLLGFSLFVFMFLVFSISAGKTFFGEGDVGFEGSGVDLKANKDLLELLGKRFIISGESVKVIDGIKRGFDENGIFVEEGNEELIEFVSGELDRLCDYELEVKEGYFDGNGFTKMLLVEKDGGSLMSNRELRRVSDSRGKFLLKSYEIVHKNVNKGRVFEIKFVKYRDCENGK